MQRLAETLGLSAFFGGKSKDTLPPQEPEEVSPAPEVVIEAPQKPDILNNLIEKSLSGEAPNILMSLRQTYDAIVYAREVYQDGIVQMDTLQRYVGDRAVLDEQQEQASQQARETLFITTIKPAIDAGLQYALGSLDQLRQSFSRDSVDGELMSKMDSLKPFQRGFQAVAEGQTSISVERLRSYYDAFATALREVQYSLEDTHNQILDVLTHKERQKIDSQITSIYLLLVDFPSLPEEEEGIDEEVESEYEEHREAVIDAVYEFDYVFGQADRVWWNSLSSEEQGAVEERIQQEGSEFIQAFFLEMRKLYRIQNEMQQSASRASQLMEIVPENATITATSRLSETRGKNLQAEWKKLAAGLEELMAEQVDIFNDDKKIKALIVSLKKILQAVISIPPQEEHSAHLNIVVFKDVLRELQSALGEWMKYLKDSQRREPILSKGDVFLHATPEMVTLSDTLAEHVEAAQALLEVEPNELGFNDFLANLLEGANLAGQVPQRQILDNWRASLEQQIEAARREQVERYLNAE